MLSKRLNLSSATQPLGFQKSDLVSILTVTDLD